MSKENDASLLTELSLRVGTMSIDIDKNMLESNSMKKELQIAKKEIKSLKNEVQTLKTQVQKLVDIINRMKLQNISNCMSISIHIVCLLYTHCMSIEYIIYTY